MKPMLFFACLLLAFSNACAQYTTPDLKLVWAEEFNYSGYPKKSNWGYEEGYIRNNELQYYTHRDKDNVRVEDGCLVITAQKEQKDAFDYTSGSINTLGKKSFYLGRIEVRAKIPTGKGSWPAIWLMGTDRPEVGWPECGEIDMMENVGWDPYVLHSTVHSPGSVNAPNPNIKRTASVKLDDAFSAFHVYALEWHPDRLDFYIDGKFLFSYKKDAVLAEFWRFSKPHYLLLNLAVGGAWGAAKGIDTSIFPLKYYVDWVRYYK